jgi:hypothetical protein
MAEIDGRVDSNRQTLTESNDRLVYLLLEQISKRNKKLSDLRTENEAQILMLSDQLRQSDAQIIALRQEIPEINRSIAVQILMKFQYGVIDKAFPCCTRRKGLYDLGLMGMRILINDGAGIFYIEFRNKMCSHSPSNLFIGINSMKYDLHCKLKDRINNIRSIFLRRDGA